eukprot:SAG11_NODE_33018_length_279_cov_1.150000_1_plen_40_part_01
MRTLRQERDRLAVAVETKADELCDSKQVKDKEFRRMIDLV